MLHVHRSTCPPECMASTCSDSARSMFSSGLSRRMKIMSNLRMDEHPAGAMTTVLGRGSGWPQQMAAAHSLRHRRWIQKVGST